MAQYGELSRKEAVDRIWEVAESIGVCMFVTWDGERQRARPVQARVAQEEDAIYFLTDVSGAKDDQITEFPIVTLAFADTHGNKYLSVTGKAKVSNDRAKIKELFSAFDKAWWDSENDPAIRLITFRPEDAEIWDGTGRIWSSVAMIAAAVTGAKPKLGDNKKVAGL